MPRSRLQGLPGMITAFGPGRRGAGRALALGPHAQNGSRRWNLSQYSPDRSTFKCAGITRDQNAITSPSMIPRQSRACLILSWRHRHRCCTIQALVAIRPHCNALAEQPAMQPSRLGSTTKNRARHPATHDSCLSPQSAAPTQAAQLFADGWAVAICGIARTRRMIARLTGVRKSSLVPLIPRSWRSQLARCELLARG
jgi:hypothetical protein